MFLWRFNITPRFLDRFGVINGIFFRIGGTFVYTYNNYNRDSMPSTCFLWPFLRRHVMMPNQRHLHIFSMPAERIVPESTTLRDSILQIESNKFLSFNSETFELFSRKVLVISTLKNKLNHWHTLIINKCLTVILFSNNFFVYVATFSTVLFVVTPSLW